MRKEIILNGGWIFHKGDIAEPISKDKGFIYCQSKTERKLSGPAAYNYPDRLDHVITKRRRRFGKNATIIFPFAILPLRISAT